MSKTDYSKLEWHHFCSAKRANIKPLPPPSPIPVPPPAPTLSLTQKSPSSRCHSTTNQLGEILRRSNVQHSPTLRHYSMSSRARGPQPQPNLHTVVQPTPCLYPSPSPSPYPLQLCPCIMMSKPPSLLPLLRIFTLPLSSFIRPLPSHSRDVCLLAENLTCSVPTLYGCEGLWSYDYGCA